MANTATGTISKISNFTTSGGYIGDTVSITIPAAPNRPTYSFTLQYNFGMASGTIVEKTHEEVTSWEVPKGLALQIPDARSGACIITCTAYKPDGTVANSTVKSITLSILPGKARPKIIKSTVEDVNEATLALTGASWRFVNGYSKAHATIGAVTKYGATILSIQVAHDGKAKGGPAGGTENEYTAVFDPTQGASFEFNVYDSRGYAATVIEQLTEVAYFPPTAALQPSVPEPDGTMGFTVKGAFWGQNFGAADNALSVFYRTKAGDGEFGAWQQMAAANVTADATSYEAQASIKVDYSKKVTIQAKAVDLLTEAESEEKTVRAFPVFYWGENDFVFNCMARLFDGLYFEEIADSIWAKRADGDYHNVFQGCNESGNTVIGWGNYANASGNTNVYGNDIHLGVANLGNPTVFRPYIRQGDVLAVGLHTAGYVTSNKAEVRFFVPFTRPIVGKPTVAASSPNNGFMLRQGNAYTHGSSSAKYCKPSSYEAAVRGYHGVEVVATFSDTTNATNNAPIGVFWSGTLTFS